MTFPSAVRHLAATLLALFAVAFSATAQHPLRVHPQNPHLLEFRGRPEILATHAEHYSSVVNKDFNFIPYLDVMKRDGMNLTRIFLAGFRHDPSLAPTDPLAPPPTSFMQPWKRVTDGTPALDGLGKWDLTQWDEAYFTRLNAFMQACSQRGILVEMTFFSTLYTNLMWQDSPFNPANNVQSYGPTNRYDTLRIVSPNLLAAQEAFVRRIVREVNGYDNFYYEIHNEPFWNEPGVKDDQEIAFHHRMLQVIREEEATLPNRHIVAHNFPQHVASMSTDFDIIDEHYPATVLGSPVAGAENLLRDHYGRGKILAFGETDTANAAQARLESWMFLLGGGSIYNGLDITTGLYRVGDEAGDNALGRSIRKTIADAARYTKKLDVVSMRRDLSWISGVPANSTLQAMSSPGQQYVAYLHHGKSQQSNFQLAYNPIDASPQMAAPVVQLPAGEWRVSWTRPSTMSIISTDEFTHTGGARTLTSVPYQEDVALRIDRTGAGDLTPPPYPTALAATPKPDGSVDLSWTAADAPDVASHRIYRTENASVAPSPGHLLSEVVLPATVFSDTTLPVGTTAHYRIVAVDANGNPSTPSDGVDATSTLDNLPYGGVARAVPGKVQAEDFDLGGAGVAWQDSTPANDGSQYRPDEGVDIEATDDADGGHHVFATMEGEWMEYTIDVAQGGVYQLEARVAGPTSGGSLVFSIGGAAIGPAVVVPAATDGSWQTIAGPEVVLPAGRRGLRMTVATTVEGDTAGAINWFALTPVVRTAPVADAGTDREIADHDFDGSATLTLDGSASLPGEAPLTSYSWSVGTTVVGTGVSPQVSLPLGDHVVRLTVTDGNNLSATDELTVRVLRGEFANDGFESGFTGWTTTGNVTIQNASPYVPTQGTRLASFNSSQSVPNGVISRTFATTPGQIYQLSFDMGVLAYNNLQQRLQVQVSGNTMLVNQTHVTNRLNNVSIRWESKAHTFTADSATTTLTFRDVSTATDSLDLTLDNVRIVPQVTRVLTVSSTAGPTAVTLSPTDAGGLGGGLTTLTRSYQNATTVTLTAQATSGGLTFQKWRKNGTDLATTPAVSVLMDGDHTLAAVYVEGPPVITAQPTGAVVASGGTATFSVTATSPSSRTYQWRFNGGNLAGANADTLVLSNVQAANSGSYDVVITSAGGSVTSASASLSLLASGSLVNGSFESGYDGWTVTGNQSVQTASLYTATHGTQLVAFNRGETPPNGVLSQSFATTPGQIYTLVFDMGVLAYNNSQQKLQVQVSGTATLVNQTHTTNRLNNQLIRWETKSHPFTADSTTTTLTFRDLSTATNALDLTLDNVRVIPQITRTLNVTSTPAAGTAITLSPADTIGRTGGTTALTRTYQNLTAVTLTAPATSGGQTFQKWRKNGVDLASTASVSVVMDGDHTLTAVYQVPVMRTLSVGSIPSSGVGITVSPVDSNGQGSGTSDFTRVYQDATTVTLTAPATIPGFTFQKWQQNANDVSTSLSVNILMDGNQTMNAVYVPVIVRTLTVESTPGGAAISISPADKNGATGGSTSLTRAYPDAASVTLTAPAAISGFNFQKWQKNGSDLATTPAVTVLMDASHTLTAVYAPIIIRTLTVESSTAGTPVDISPADNDGLAGGSTSLSRLYQNGGSVTLTAPASIPGFLFEKWTRDGSDLATTPAVNVLMDADHTLTAVYQPVILRTLTLDSGPTSGVAVTVTPADDNGQHNGVSPFTRIYADGSTVTLAVPAQISGHVFEKWLKNDEDLATTPSVSLLMDADHALTAVYQPIILHTLTIESTPDDTAIAIAPADDNGLADGTTSLTRAYPETTTVTLTAPATLPGFTFEKWQQDGSDLATTTAITVLMDADHTLTAVYEPIILHTLTVESTPDGTAIAIAPADDNGLADGTTSLTRAYPETTTVTLTAPATSGGLVFQKWQKNGSDVATTPAVSVLMDDDHALTAIYAEGPPIISGQPANAAVAAGATVTFSVTASGVTPPAYQWRFNRNTIGGATSATLSIPNAQAADAGSYDVVVSGPGGSVTSSPATLSLLAPPPAGLVNGSFENGYTGWTPTGNQAVQTASLYTATDGTRLVSFNNGEVTPNGVLTQTFPTVPGLSYVLAFDMGVLAYNNSQQKLQVQVTGNATTLVNQTHTTNRLNNQLIRWESKSHPFIANSTSTTLTFRDVSTATAALDLTLDNVRVIPQVTRTLTVASTPAAGTVIGLTPLDNTGQGGGATGLTRLYPNATTVTLTAPAFTGGRTFQKWQKNGVDLATTSSVSVLLDADINLTAVYVEGGSSIPSALKIMPLGDSITFGYDGNNAGYRGPLYNLLSPIVPGMQFVGTMALNPGSLPATPVDQRNHQGLSGYNILDVSNNLDGLDTTRFVALGGADRNPAGGYWLTGGNGTGRQPIHPDIITMMIGTNDLSNPTGSENRLRNLVSKLTTLRPDARLFIAKITPAPNFPAVSVSYNEFVTSLVADVRAAGKNVHLVDLHTGFPANGMGSDGLHPNSTGFLWMAQRWYDAILASYPPVDPTGPPLVTDPPDSGSVGMGTAVTLKVTAQGAGSLSYQWRFNGTPIPSATSATLELTNVQSSAAGSYDVVVSNAFGQVTSQPATLTVLVAAALANGSFEADLASWTASGNVQARPGTDPYSATDGSKIAAFNSSNSTPNGALTQLVSTVPGTVYTLTFDLGLLAYSTAPQQIQVSATGSTTLLGRNISINGPGNGTTRWFSQTATFTADGPSTTLTFRDISTSTNSIDLLLDNVRLTGGAAAKLVTVSEILPNAPDAELPEWSLLSDPAGAVTDNLGSASLAGTPGDHTISLDAVTGGSYFLERSSDLAIWEKVGEEIILTAPGPVTFPAPPLIGQPVFYRIGRHPDSPAD